MRARSIVLTGAAALFPLGLLATSCDDDGGDTARFCAEVEDHSTELTARPETVAAYDRMLDTYRRIGDDAPLAIESEWRALVLNYETASTVDVTDPESMQRALAQAYATEESALAVHAFVRSTCDHDLGPAATVVPHPTTPPPPVTTLAPGATPPAGAAPPPTTGPG